MVCASILGVALAAGEDGDKPKHTIKDVMKSAHKEGLLKKVLGGQASEQEKLTLLDYYISLVENTPPKGGSQSWHNLAGKVTLAAAKVAVGREGATAELKKATNCGACHKQHKGD